MWPGATLLVALQPLRKAVRSPSSRLWSGNTSGPAPIDLSGDDCCEGRVSAVPAMSSQGIVNGKTGTTDQEIAECPVVELGSIQEQRRINHSNLTDHVAAKTER